MTTTYEKWLASAPTDQREFRTVEIYHPSFPVVQRFVQDRLNQNLILESTAPRHAGQEVLFTAISMSIVEPAEAANGEQILTINLGAVSNQIEDVIALVIGEDYLTPIEVIYRKFYSGDLTAPVLVLTLNVSNVNFEGYTAVSFTAEDSDLNNKSSGEKYTLERFPTLSGL